MLTVLLVVHIIVTTALIAVILLQRNSSDGLAGIGGGGSSNMNILSSRSKANFLTKITSFLAALFILLSLTMATIVSRQNQNQSVVDQFVDQPKNNTSDNIEEKPSIPVSE